MHTATPTHRTLTTLTAVVALGVTACGGGGGAQSEVADMMIAEAAEEGIALDADCVRDVAGKLSDQDAEALVAAGVDGDVQLSDEADAIGEEMFGCLDTDALIDELVAEMGGEDVVDVDCLKEVLDEAGPAALESGDGLESMMSCFTLDG